MTTMCDRILDRGMKDVTGHALDIDIRGMSGDAMDNENIHPIMIDNVARYYYEKYMKNIDSPNTDIPENEIANIAPPFMAFFMEWDIRSTPALASMLGIVGEAHIGVSWACADLQKIYNASLDYEEGKQLNASVAKQYPKLVKEYEKQMAEDLRSTLHNAGLDDGGGIASFQSDPGYLAWLKLTGMPHVNPFVMTGDDHRKLVNAQTIAAALIPHTGIRWTYQSMGYIEYPKHDIRGPLFASMTPIQTDGRMKGTGIMHRSSPELLLPRSMKPPLMSENEMVRAQWISYYLIMPCLFAINFLHMKNVLLLPNRPAPKLAKQYRKSHRKDLVQYFTMHVVTPKQAIRYEKTKEIPDDIKDRVHQPFHIRQGAWRHYADEDGHRLFGKYAGDFFVPAYAAGTKDEGTNVATRAVVVK